MAKLYSTKELASLYLIKGKLFLINFSKKNKSKLFTGLLFLFLGINVSFGQVSNYTFSESAGTYTTIAGTTAHATGWDDAVTTNTISIGFTFTFNGTSYTTCSINSNGFITFGATTSLNNLYTPISSGTGYDGAISGLGFDLISNASTITYTTTGSAPNRTFIVQWNNARRYSGGAIAGNFNFQITLTETSNIINVVYGACTPATNNNYNVQVGLRGAANTDFNNRSFASNAIWDASTTAGGTNAATCRTRSTAYPTNGRTFTWTPPAPPTITSLGAVSGCVGSSLVITGTNLTGATAVTIGGTAAAITANTATTVTVTVGIGTTGTVQVTTPNGTATSLATFTVNPNPAAIGGGAATVCTGAVTPTFTNATTGGTWSTSNANATINTSGIVTGVTAGAVNVIYTVGTCSSTTALTVQQTPGAIAGGSATVCNGTTSPAFTNPNGGGTWSITPGTGSATITGAGVLTGTGIGTVTVNYTIGSCTPATFNVTVNPNPAAIGGGAATVCTGAVTPAFTNATAGGTWSTSNANATINASGIVTGVTAGAVNVIYAIGTCNRTTALTVQQTPGAIAGGSVTVCVGTTTPAFTNPNGGGTWSITSGTGTASITVGGVATGLTAGMVTVVYTIGTCIPATTTLTVNPNPAAIGGGSATVCTGATTPAFTNGTAGGTWSTSNANATINASGIVTGVTVGAVNVIYTIGTCTSSTALTVTGGIATLATAPNPANAATGICAIGGGAITEISWTAAAGAVSYDMYFGTAPVPVFTVNQTSTAYSLPTSLLPSTTYYWKIVPIGSCGASTGVPIVWSFTTSATPCYCASVPRNVAFNDGITRVQFNTINNVTSANAGNEYTDYTGSQNTNVIRGSSQILNVWVNTDGNFTQAQMAWIDWNQNGDFTDAGESYALGAATNVANGLSNGCPATINVPVTALLGVTRMRISSRFNSYAGSCSTGYDGEVEDYSVTIIAGAPCTTPADQPTALLLTPGGTFINGSFTAATSAPDHYLVIINTTGVVPTPTNGTNYVIGDNIGGTNIIVDTDNNTTFVAGQLSLSTTYYIYVFSYNTACSGGPLYNTTLPLNGTTITIASLPTYCTPVTTSAAVDRLYVSVVEFVGTLLDTSNTSTTDGVPDGFQDFTALPTKSSQAQGGPINMKLTSATGRGFWKVWVDWNKDGDFFDTGEEVYNPSGFMFASTTFGFIVPYTTVPGDYRMRVRVQNTIKTFNPGAGTETGVYFDSCNSFDPLVIGAANYRTYGEAEDYLFTVIPKCDNNITSITNPAICGAVSGTVTATISATSTSGTINWYDALTGGTLLGNTASGANWTTPAISASTTYYATAFGSCESLVRTPVFVEVKPVPGLIIATPNVTICGENSIIQLDATGNNEVAYLINENFEAGTLGVFSNINSDATSAAAKAKTAWKNKSSIYVPSGNRWFPAITSGFGTNKFALTSMDDFTSVPLPTVPMQNSLTLTTSVNPSATTFINLTLTFKVFYSRYYADGVNPAIENCNVEVSTNGGGTWTTLPGGVITSDQGYGSNFVTLTHNLNAYIASNNLKVRIRVLGDGSGTGTAGDGVAIDDVKLFGDRPLTPFFALGGGIDGFYDATAITTPYDGLPANTIYIRPTLTQLEQPAFVINVSSNLNNGCVTSGTINVTNNTKIWKGTVSSNWNNAANWAPATVPTISNCVIIPTATPNQTILSTGAAGNGKNLLIKTGGVLEIQSGNTLTIKEIVDVNATGAFNIKNNSSLVQIDNVANTGNINMERIANIKLQDYSYWSAPVGNGLAGTFPVQSVSPLTPAGYIFKWGTTTANANGGEGTWVNTAENMIPAKGYILRAPNGFTNAATSALTANFIGVPNNGVYSPTIFRGNDYGGVGLQGMPRTATDDNWNLVGNPYPSAIGVNEFLTANANIQGFVKIWTHGQLPTNATSPFYQNYSSNYYPNDYISINSTAATSGPGDVKIAAGQGFMVLMNPGLPGSSTVTFNNTMRDATFANNQFYKNSNAITTVERHRIWLDLITPTGSVNRTVVGYIDGATQAEDRLYDAFTDNKPSQNFYSLINNKPMVIQGRELPFDINDTVPMGVQIPTNGTYTIAIAAIDGLFSGGDQTIYLEDKLLNTIHNLKASQYQFMSNQGIINNRFVLRYINNTLSNTDFDYSNEIKIFANNCINISSINQSIKEVIVYDILGKVLIDKKEIGKKEISLNQLKPTTNVLIVKVILDNNGIIIKKVIF
jgi:hypothetical protein